MVIKIDENNYLDDEKDKKKLFTSYKLAFAASKKVNSNPGVIELTSNGRDSFFLGKGSDFITNDGTQYGTYYGKNNQLITLERKI